MVVAFVMKVIERGFGFVVFVYGLREGGARRVELCLFCCIILYGEQNQLDYLGFGEFWRG